MTPWGGRIDRRTSTSSTMDDARALEDAGAPDGSLVRADFQAAGQGRHKGRRWEADAGGNLLFTVYWSPARFRVPEFAPSLTVGLGVCLWLEQLGVPEPRLKWPNDILVGDRKLAGILVRRRLTAAGPQSIHAGVGVNLAAAADRPDFRRPPVGLADLGIALTPDEALAGLLPALAAALGHPDPRGECEQRLWRRGEEAELSVPDAESPPRRGLVLGLDTAGCLVWQSGGLTEALSSGE